MHDASSAVSAAPRRTHLLLAALVVTLLAVYGSFVPLKFKSLGWQTAFEQFRQIPYLQLGLYNRADWVANLLLFAPLGFLWTGALDLDRRRRWPAVLAAPLIAALLAALAVAIEAAQLWTVNRTVSRNDILAEWLGAVAGVGLWFPVGRRAVAALRALFEPQSRATASTRLLRLYTLGLVLYALQPLDLALGPEAVRAKYAAGRILLVPFAHGYGGPFDLLWQIGADVLLFVPIGMMFRIGGRGLRSVPAAVGLSLLLAAAVETAQLLVFSRSTDVTDILVAGVGALVGAWLAPFLRRAGPRVPGARHRAWVACGLLLLYAAPLAAIYWHPYHLADSLEAVRSNVRGMFAAPFRAYYYGSEFKALANIVRGLMLFVPVGAVLRWAAGPRSAWTGALACIAGGLFLGLPIEMGQALSVDRVADVTDLAIYAVGTCLGWTVCRLVLGDDVSAGQQ